jgi:UDP-N-acetylglucosamine--N-acetylmuramyl-(pentapeptide) pyrophosphoryl-undecaprenol N-acetylglucosamine transferase
VGYSRVWAPKFRRYKSFRNLLDFYKIPIAFAQSCFSVLLFMPDVMLIKGGYAALFPALAARLLFIPLVVHESDSIPGKTNLFWGRHARRVFLAFEHAKQFFNPEKSEVVGLPIRPALLVLVPRTEADKPTVFITGGSQGAQAINEVVELAKFELEKKFTIIHQKDGTWDVQQMRDAYAAADVVVSRAGSAIFEIAALGKPAILIPLKGSAQEHQMQNALEFAKHGAVVMDQDNLLPHLLISEIQRAYDQRATLSEQIKKFAKPDAATIVAQELLSAAS